MIFVRRYWYMDTVSEIAQRYGISESRVKSSLFRSRKKLRASLQVSQRKLVNQYDSFSRQGVIFTVLQYQSDTDICNTVIFQKQGVQYWMELTNMTYEELEKLIQVLAE